MVVKVYTVHLVLQPTGNYALIDKLSPDDEPIASFEVASSAKFRIPMELVAYLVGHSAGRVRQVA